MTTDKARPTDIHRVVHEEIVARIDRSSSGVALAEQAERMAADAEAEARAISTEVAALKGTAKAAKVEIADWKAWWAALPADRALVEVAKVHIEITRLAGSLPGIEARVASAANAMAVQTGVAIALRARADAIARHGAEAEETVREHLRAALEDSPTKKKRSKRPAPKRVGTKKAAKSRKRITKRKASKKTKAPKRSKTSKAKMTVKRCEQRKAT